MDSRQDGRVVQLQSVGAHGLEPPLSAKLCKEFARSPRTDKFLFLLTVNLLPRPELQQTEVNGYASLYCNEKFGNE